MKVTFTKTGNRRYRVSVDGSGVVSSFIEPAAGFDPKLPHDLAHFIVENELNIMGCIFGPLSNGGNGFRPVDETKKQKSTKRENPNRRLNQKEAEMTERIIDIAFHQWTGRKYTGALVKDATKTNIDLICRKFDEVSEVWSKLHIGESMTLEWTAKLGNTKRRLL